MPIPIHVSGSTDKDGRKRASHIARRHKKIAASTDESPMTDSALDAFIVKHGGREHLGKTLQDMTPEQRAKLIDAMADLGEVSHAEVMIKLGLREPEPVLPDPEEIAEHIRSQFLERLARAVEDGTLEQYEADTLESILKESGPAAAVDKLIELVTARNSASLALMRPQEQVTHEDAASVAAADAANDIGPQARADELYGKHTESANKAVRLNFEIEKREIRKWKIPEQMRENAAQFARDAAQFLAEWVQFCAEHGLSAE